MPADSVSGEDSSWPVDLGHVLLVSSYDRERKEASSVMSVLTQDISLIMRVPPL